MSGYGWANNPNPNMHPQNPSFSGRPPSNAPTMGGQNFYWVKSSRGQPIPPNAVLCGKDHDRSNIYVGLANHCGDELPAKIIPERGAAYICYNGQEIAVDNYRVLVEKKLTWVPNTGSVIPPGAVPAGRTAAGETLYVGRRMIEGKAMSVGKVHPSHGCLYVPYGGKELHFEIYEILVYI